MRRWAGGGGVFFQRRTSQLRDLHAAREGKYAQQTRENTPVPRYPLCSHRAFSVHHEQASPPTRDTLATAVLPSIGSDFGSVGRMRALTVSTRRFASLFYGAVRVRIALRKMRGRRNSPRSCHRRQRLVRETTVVMTRVTVLRLVKGTTFAAMRLGQEKGTYMLVEATMRRWWGEADVGRVV